MSLKSALSGKLALPMPKARPVKMPLKPRKG
jgi:hypothetical protein